MSHLRRINRLVIVLSLLVPTLVLTATPAAAQDDDERRHPITVFVFSNVITNAEREEDDDERWQVQVSIRSLRDCNPEQGDRALTTRWLDAGDEAGARLSLEECVFEISATVRDASRSTECGYAAQLAWGTNPADSSFAEGPVLTSSRPADESRLAIRRTPGTGCAGSSRTLFAVDGTAVVRDLPEGSADSDLLELARRAAAIAEFDVLVEADYASGDDVPSGCDTTASVVVRGDGVRVTQSAPRTDKTCSRSASIVDATAPFEIVEGAAERFDDSGANILVDLTSLVRMPHARIAIVQDVNGSGNRGQVSYSITRSCGDVLLASTPATSTLYEGRFTVHSPDSPAFGPTAVYPAVAASATSGTIVGCTVSVTASGVPGDCSVAGARTRTLTWTAANQLRNFDFEFDIDCGTTAGTVTTTAPTITADTTAEVMTPVTEETPTEATAQRNRPRNRPRNPTAQTGPPEDVATG